MAKSGFMPGFMPSLSVCTITFENSQNDWCFSRFQTCFAKLFFYPALLCSCAIFLAWFLARKYWNKGRISLLVLLCGRGPSHVIGLYFMSRSFYFHLWFQFILSFGPLWRRWTVILHPGVLSNHAALDEFRSLSDSSGTCSSGLMAKLTNWTDIEWKGQEGKLWKATEDRGEPFKGFCSHLPGVISCTWVWDWDRAVMALPDALGVPGEKEVSWGFRHLAPSCQAPGSLVLPAALSAALHF